MEKSIYSPIELWRDFSPNDRLLKKNIVERKKENGFVLESFFVDGVDSSRVFCKIAIPDNTKKNKKIILLLNDGGKLFSDRELMKVSQGIFVVATVDYAGKTDLGDFFTKYPEELNYGNISVSRFDLNSGKSVFDSPWFLWARNIRIAMTALFEIPGVNKEGLFLGGIGRGSLLSMQIAAVDKRCTALLVVSGYGYNPAGSSNLSMEPSSALTEENERWLSAFSMNANAKLITVPTLITADTNNPYNNIDGIGVLKSTFATDKVYVHITPSMSYAISENAFSAIKAFISDSCSGKNNMPVIAEPTAETVDGKVVFGFSSQTPLKNCYLIYSHGKEYNKNRNWYSVKMRSKDGKNFSCEISLSDVTDELHYFVNCQTNSFSLTSVMKQTDIPHRNFLPGERRIVYNSGMGKTFFFSENGAFESDSHLRLEQGPFKIDGITGTQSISSYVLSDIRFKPKDGNILSLDVFGSTSKDFSISLFKETNGTLTEYNALFNYTSQPKWDKLMLTPSSFKNDKNIDMKDWDNIKKISFLNVDGMLFNNILWI